MIALYILGGLVLLIFGVNRLRVSVHVQFGSELLVWAKLGPKTVQIIPKPPAKPKKEKKKKPETEKPPEPKPEKAKKGLNLTLDELRELLPAVWESLQRILRNTGRRIRIDPLYVHVVYGSPDPCQVAEWYGASCSALWAVMPRLEGLVQLPDPEIHFNMDFNAVETRVAGEFGIAFRIGDFAAIGFGAVPPLVKWFLGYKKRSRTAAKAEKPAENTEENNEKIA